MVWYASRRGICPSCPSVRSVDNTQAPHSIEATDLTRPRIAAVKCRMCDDRAPYGAECNSSHTQRPEQDALKRPAAVLRPHLPVEVHTARPSWIRALTTRNVELMDPADPFLRPHALLMS